MEIGYRLSRLVQPVKTLLQKGIQGLVLCLLPHRIRQEFSQKQRQRILDRIERQSRIRVSQSGLSHPVNRYIGTNVYSHLQHRQGLKHDLSRERLPALRNCYRTRYPASFPGIAINQHLRIFIFYRSENNPSENFYHISAPIFPHQRYKRECAQANFIEKEKKSNFFFENIWHFKKSTYLCNRKQNKWCLHEESPLFGKT